jgi:hypothetical protein
VDDFRHQGEGAARQPRFGALTKREGEILKLLARGKSVKEISCEFELSGKTAEAHKFSPHAQAQYSQQGAARAVSISKKDHPASEADSGIARTEPLRVRPRVSKPCSHVASLPVSTREPTSFAA